MSTGRGRGAGVLRALKLLAAAAILAWVGQNLPWHDQLIWSVDGQELGLVEGQILGDWKSSSVSFLTESASDESWPPDLAAAVSEGRAFACERDGQAQEHGTVWDWRPSLPRAFRDVQANRLALAMLSFCLALLCGTTRWWRLLALAGCFATFWNTLRLTFIGLFFNLVVPGLTGGDLVKTAVVVKENPGKRPDALVSVLVDRVVGLLSLVALAAVVVLLVGGAFSVLRIWVLGVLLAGLLGAAIYSSSSLRRTLRWDALLARAPFSDRLQALDQAAVMYFRHPGQLAIAVLLSLGNHFFAVLGCVFLGMAFGAQLNFLDYYVIVPVANILSCVPLAPGGWGVGEAAYKELFELVGASGTLGVAVSVTFRLAQLALGLVGGVFLLLPGARIELEDVRETA